MKPLRVTFYPITPLVVPDRAPHLDALLGSAVYRGAERAEISDALALTEQLPLEKAVGADGEWVWKASRLEYQQVGGIEHIHHVRRFDIHRWALDRERGFWFGNADKISNGSGEMKAFAFSEPTMVVAKAIAWCVGDPEAVCALLHSEIHTLGRRAGSGWGWLRDDGASTTVEVVDDPEEALRWRRRSLPLSLEASRLPGHHRAMVTVRAPYWQRSQRQEALEYAGDPLG